MDTISVSKKKICIAHGMNMGFQSGGTNRVTAFINSLVETGYEVILVIPRPRGELSEEIKTSVTLSFVPVTPHRTLRNQIHRALLQY